MKGIEALEAAIKDAREKKILMFGAASDQGYNESNPNSIYPVSAGGVFCIGAAKVSGQAEDAAERESHYVFPGRNISSAPRRMSKTNDLQASIELTSSSSFATALASGLAALILYCVEITEEERQQSQKYRNIEPSPINRKDLTTYDTMKSIFDSMVAVENKKYIAVKTFFDAKFADRAWEDDGEERLVDSVAKIIRYDMVPWFVVKRSGLMGRVGRTPTTWRCIQIVLRLESGEALGEYRTAGSCRSGEGDCRGTGRYSERVDNF